MIKYFYYEIDNTGSFLIHENEKILDKKPQTDDGGYSCEKLENGFCYYIDVEKTINYYGKLDRGFQKVYDKLLIEQRNKKLNTL